MVTKEMICAAHDICLKKGDFVLSASLLERIYLAMRDKADGRDSAGWDAYEDLRKASDEMVLNLRQRVQELEKQRDELLEVLLTAAETFASYAEIHAAKTPPDIVKAEFNRDRAQMCFAAIASVKGEQE